VMYPVAINDLMFSVLLLFVVVLLLLHLQTDRHGVRAKAPGYVTTLLQNPLYSLYEYIITRTC
jgi:hypothetical protein